MNHTCSLGNFTFDSETSFGTHGDICEETYLKCQYCGYGYKRKKMEEHLKVCNQNPVPCLVPYREQHQYYKNKLSFIPTATNEKVHHPEHYKSEFYCEQCAVPIECITISRHFNFNLGNVIKYVWRAFKKNEFPGEDLEKAMWYLFDEINQHGNGRAFDWAKKKLEENGYEVKSK